MSGNIRILVVDDEPQIQRFLKLGLTAGGFAVSAATTAAEAIKAIATSAPDLVLLDLGLPDLDGKDVIRQARAFSTVPIIIVSARDREVEKIEALDLGADDYVNKPFGIGELLARIRTALRHHDPVGHSAAVLSHGQITVDVAQHHASKNGAALKLTPKEFDLLALLMRNPGRVLTHRQILTSVWGPAHAEDLQYLRVLIGQLRGKLEDDQANPRFIQTEPGIGYRIASD
ncbi:MAG: response regulator transcription factor [Alphaproteobacteria bacterium]|nr:MAG: response regulator transcription factor [Alphaproteobacteria bacterium]